MAFEGLSDRLQATIQRMRGKGKVTEADIKAMMRSTISIIRSRCKL